MNGKVAAYRGSHRTQRDNYMILHVEGVDNKEKAQELVGKKAVWKAEGKKETTITGTITAAHGAKGAVRAHFERGMPGQSLGTEVSVE